MKINTLGRWKSLTTWGGSAIAFSGFCYGLSLGKLDAVSGSLAGCGIVINALGNLIGMAQSKREKEAKKTAEARLVAAETRIAELQPIPLERRLRGLLDKISPKILKELKGGNSRFSVEISSQHFSALQSLAAEDADQTFIHLVIQPMMALGPGGPIHGVDFSLNPRLATYQE